MKTEPAPACFVENAEYGVRNACYIRPGSGYNLYRKGDLNVQILIIFAIDELIQILENVECKLQKVSSTES